jgi:GntR family transcriptional regulator/MocR family aminotransferase
MKVIDGSPISIYEQIYRAIRDAISIGELPPATQLPTSRELAGMLDVARNTVVSAYSRLAADGYLLTNKRRGTRVADGLPRLLENRGVGHLAQTGISASINQPGPPYDQRADTIQISYRARQSLESEQAEEAVRAPFGLSGPDPAFCPRHALGRLLAEEFENLRAGIDPLLGVQKFRVVMSSYLRRMRGVRCQPTQIFPVRDLAGALDLTARMMIDPGHFVYVEDPAEDVVCRTVRGAGAHVAFMPSDDRGADIGRVKGPPARLIVVSPSVDYPLGRQMSESRRDAVMSMARNWNATIFENDTGWELSYSGSRVEAMQGGDRSASIFYFGTFGQTLGPQIQAGYLVVPPKLVEPFGKAARRLYCGPDPFVLSALARYVESADYAAHVKTIRSAYAARLEALISAMQRHLPNAALIKPTGGLQFAVRFDDAIDEKKIRSGAAKRGLSVAPLSHFYFGTGPGESPAGLVLGLGSVPDKAIETMVCRLAESVTEVQRSASIVSSAA